MFWRPWQLTAGREGSWRTVSQLATNSRDGKDESELLQHQHLLYLLLCLMIIEWQGTTLLVCFIVYVYLPNSLI